MTSIRISAATPEADLAAAVRPGLESVFLPRVESAAQVEEADAIITTLERLRGIRPGTVELRLQVASPTGVTNARAIAASSPRIRRFGVGPTIELEHGDDSLSYARGECELVARGLDLASVDTLEALD